MPDPKTNVVHIDVFAQEPGAEAPNLIAGFDPDTDKLQTVADLAEAPGAGTVNDLLSAELDEEAADDIDAFVNAGI
jgi:hypothetical protein